MAPTIICNYSHIYDDNREKIFALKYTDRKDYPSVQSIKQLRDQTLILVKEYAHIILPLLERITNKEWVTKTIKAYFVGCCPFGSFSDPLTINCMGRDNRGLKTPEDAFDMLIHEIIHVKLSETPTIFAPTFKKLENQYPSYDQSTLIHVLVHTIHKKIYETLWRDERMNLDIERAKGRIAYERSWEIAIKDYDSILKDLNSTHA